VRQAFWSPDDSRIAFLKAQDRSWQVWVFPAANPESSVSFSPQPVNALHGWIDNHTLLATDTLNAYWLSEETLPQAVALKDIYRSLLSDHGVGHDSRPSCQLRSPPCLRLRSQLSFQATIRMSASLISSLFLYEVRSKRRVVLAPPDQWAQHGEWSRDGLQVFFSGTDTLHRSVVYRIFWDGTSVQRALLAAIM